MRRFLQTVCLFSNDTDYVPHLLRRGASLGMLALVLLSFLTANLQALLWQSSSWLVSNILPAIVVERTNIERGLVAGAPLRRSNVLDMAATLKAEHMAREGYFSHFSPEGVSPWHWFDEVGYVYAHAGENLAVHFSDAGEVVEAWMHSPTHRANIVNGNYTEIGVGTAKGMYEGFETVFVVQLFGTPAVLSSLPDGQVEAMSVSFNDDPRQGGSMADSVMVPALTMVTTTATASPVAFAYESTVRTENDTESAALLPDKSTTDYFVSEEGVGLYTGLMATSSGLPVVSVATQASAGATDTALMARVATQPSMVLTSIYITLSVVIGGMLVLALTLTARTHRWWRMAESIALLLLMAGLVTIHLALTGGAVVA